MEGKWRTTISNCNEAIVENDVTRKKVEGSAETYLKALASPLKSDVVSSYVPGEHMEIFVPLLRPVVSILRDWLTEISRLEESHREIINESALYKCLSIVLFA